jgi:hypothetical protein
MKNGDVNHSCDLALQDSLSSIKQAHTQRHLLIARCTTPTILASRIEFCDILLGEVSGIRASLAKHLEHARGAAQVGHAELNS